MKPGLGLGRLSPSWGSQGPLAQKSGERPRAHTSCWQPHELCWRSHGGCHHPTLAASHPLQKPLHQLWLSQLQPAALDKVTLPSMLLNPVVTLGPHGTRPLSSLQFSQPLPVLPWASRRPRGPSLFKTHCTSQRSSFWSLPISPPLDTEQPQGSCLGPLLNSLTHLVTSTLQVLSKLHDTDSQIYITIPYTLTPSTQTPA